jgi:hypothetical protein
MVSFVESQVEFLDVAQELPDLVWFGLSAVILEVQRPSGLGMLKNVVAAPDAVQAIAERFGHFAQIRKVKISGPGQ